MAHWPAGKEASLGESGHRYERHRPEQTLLYQLVGAGYCLPHDRHASDQEGRVHQEDGTHRRRDVDPVFWRRARGHDPGSSPGQALGAALETCFHQK